MKTILHPKTSAGLESTLRHPSGSVIFHGRRGLGKATAARELATILGAKTYPDLYTVGLLEKASITIEQIRELIAELSLRQYSSHASRVVIIDDAHLLTTEAQNALLKILEEPSADTLIILIAQSLQSLLVTVRSRARMIGFLSPGVDAITKYLTETTKLDEPSAVQIAELSGGAPGVAVTLAAKPTEAAEMQAFTTQATSILGLSIFQRLILAGKLISSSADIDRLTEALHHDIVSRTASGQIPPDQAKVQLTAIEHFHRLRASKVTPRVSLESLMLELGV